MVVEFEYLPLVLIQHIQQMRLILQQVIDHLRVLLSHQLNPGNSGFHKGYLPLVQYFLDAGLHLDHLLPVHHFHHSIVLQEVEVLEEHQTLLLKQAQSLQTRLQL